MSIATLWKFSIRTLTKLTPWAFGIRVTRAPASSGKLCVIVAREENVPSTGLCVPLEEFVINTKKKHEREKVFPHCEFCQISRRVNFFQSFFLSLYCLIPSMSNSRNIYSQHPEPPHLQTLPLSSLPSHPTPPSPHSSSLHKSSGCILKGAKIFTLSKVVKGFCVHTGADKEEAPSAWPKENCWNKSAHTKTQRDNGAGAGPDPETETHRAPEHTDTYTQSAWLGTKSAHRLIFIFLEHTLFGTYSIRRRKTS